MASPLIRDLLTADRRAGEIGTAARFAKLEGDKEAVHDLLVAFADEQPEAINRRNAYIHVNGFLKLVLLRLPTSGMRVTFHYWPPSEIRGPSISRPHSHRFGFSSILLSGNQEFQHFTQAYDPDTSEEYVEVRYRPFAGGRLALLDKGRRSILMPTDVFRRSPLRDRYEIDADTVHAAITHHDSPCATLVLRGPREKSAATTYYREQDLPSWRRLTLQRGYHVAPTRASAALRATADALMDDHL